MPQRPCPICQSMAPRLLESMTRYAQVIYYRCDKCGHVWNVSKSDPDGPIQHVTEPPEPTPKP